MSIATLARRMADAGASADLIAIAVEEMEALQTSLDARRVADRERKRAQREREKSADVTGHSAQCHSDVTDKGSLEVSPPAPPLPKPSKIAPLSPPKSKSVEVPNWMPADEWAAFKEMRRKMRGIPFTETAERTVIGKLDKLRGEGHDPAKLLSKAVERGHRTVFEDETTRAKGPVHKLPMTREELGNAIRYHLSRNDTAKVAELREELKSRPTEQPPPQIASVIRGASSALKVGRA